VALGSSLSASGIRTHPVGGLSMATAVAELTRLVFSGAAITVVLDQGPGSQTEAMELQARFGQQVNVVVLARSQLEAYFSVAAVGRWLSINGASEDDVADTLERLRPTGVTKKALQGLTKRLLGREYRVAEDGGAIAGLMREAEISPEMKGLLLEIIG
jgi:hypothetical protein